MKINIQTIITCCLVVLSMTLVSCGIKPGYVSPPSDEKADPFPRTYPDIDTDPVPPGPHM